MAGYRRFIAYVYDYESGKKGSNCGFIKVEVKDQQCSVEIHLHCPGLPENVKCNIYGFTRKDGLINGILLDTCETEKETVECLIITDATDMNDSGVAMGKLGGMIITSDTGGFFGTEWDDQPIRPENFHEIKAMPDADIPESAKITSQKPEVPEDMVLQEMPEELEDISEKPEDTSLTKVPDDSLSIEPSANIPAQGTSDNKPGTESSYISDNTVEDSNSSENARNPVRYFFVLKANIRNYNAHTGENGYCAVHSNAAENASGHQGVSSMQKSVRHRRRGKIRQRFFCFLHGRYTLMT